ncbi:MAG: hypothetical protein ABI423_11665, partial [Burkholderiales bacterium]
MRIEDRSYGAVFSRARARSLTRVHQWTGRLAPVMPAGMGWTCMRVSFEPAGQRDRLERVCRYACDRPSRAGAADYYAGLATQKERQTPKMSQHLEAFLRLASEAILISFPA